MKKSMKLFILVGIMSLPFISYSNNDGKDFPKDIEKKIQNLNDNIPDGLYYFNNFNLELTFFEGKLVKYVDNGNVLDLSTTPRIIAYYYGNNSEKKVMELFDILNNVGIPCIRASKAESNDKNNKLWIIECSTITPCWYNKE